MLLSKRHRRGFVWRGRDVPSQPDLEVVVYEAKWSRRGITNNMRRSSVAIIRGLCKYCFAAFAYQTIHYSFARRRRATAAASGRQYL